MRAAPLPSALLRCLLAGLAALTLGGPSDAWAQWVWKDGTGRVNASDLPPPRSVPEQDILQRPAPGPRRPSPQPAASAGSESLPAAQPQAAARASTDPDLEKRRKALESARAASQAAEDPAIAARRRDNCQRARAMLAALESGQRMSRFNAKGEREMLDDQARGEETQRARQVIASDCR